MRGESSVARDSIRPMTVVRRRLAASLLILVGSAGAIELGGAATARAQTSAPPTLTILSPQTGDVVDPTLDVIVVADGAGSAQVRGELLIDGAPVRTAIHVPGDDGVVVALTTGAERTLVVRDLPEGRHTLRLVPAPGEDARPSDTVTMSVRASGPLSLPVVLIAAALVAVLVLYRRRILDPRMRRFSRDPGDGPPDGPDPPVDHPTT
jgi:hypothetical protein